MTDTRLAPDEEGHEGSSNAGGSVGMEINPPPQQEEPPIEAPVQDAPQQENPAILAMQRECLLSMKEMFDQLKSNLKQDAPDVPAAPNRAPIDKLARFRAYTFTGDIEENPEEAEKWLERTTQVLIRQLQCSDEHKLECAISLLADEALSWWETTTLTAPAESVTWQFFVAEFKKKYISEQYLAERRNLFLYLKQGNKPIEQYVAEFCKYFKYGSEYIKTEEQKCRKFTEGLNDELGSMFTALGIKDFQHLVNQAIATEARQKAAEKRKNRNWGDKKQKRDDRSQWQLKKAKYSKEGSSSNVSGQKSHYIPKPQLVDRSVVPAVSIQSTGKSEKIPVCKFCQKNHYGQCRVQMKLCYGCGGDDHYIRDCPQRNDRVSARPSIQSGSGPSNRGRGPRQAHSGSQGKGKGQQSNAPTYQESRAPARVYHIRGKDEEESPDVIADRVEDPRQEDHLVGSSKGREKGVVIRD